MVPSPPRSPSMPSTVLNLTPAALKSLPADGREHWLHDAGGTKSVAGLSVRVRGTGAATFVLTKKIDGRLARVTLGRVGEITVGDAREKARRTLAEIILTGASPNAAKRARRDRGVTLGTAFADYLDGRGIKATTLESYRRMFRLHLSRWERRPLLEITRADVRGLYAKVSRDTVASANLTMRLLRAVFNHAAGEYLDPEGRPVVVDNPVRELSRKRAWKKIEPRRARIATTELGAWFDAVKAARETSPVQADFIELLLLTGLRRREAEPLRWSDVDLAGGTLRIADTKGGRALEVPLSNRVLAILERRKEEGGAFVFPGTGKTGHIVEPKSVCQTVAKLSNVVASPHALRRTFVSVGESLELSPYVLKRLVGHSVAASDVTGTHYVEIELQRLRAATQAITDAMLSYAGRGTSPVALPSGRRGVEA